MTTAGNDHEARAAGLSDDDGRHLLRLARQALVDHLSTGHCGDRITERLAERPAASPALREPRASFVTLRRRATGELRGCRGEIRACRPLAESVMRMAVAAATDDPRMSSVTLEELPDVHITVSALTDLEPIAPEAVEVGHHGLVIMDGPRAGLLLPSVPVGLGWSRAEFLAGLCRKAGLPRKAWRKDTARLYAFESEVWEEDRS